MKRILSLMLTVSLILSVIASVPIAASAAEETLYGVIDAYNILSDNFGKECLSIKFYDSNGNTLIYSSENLLVNGIQYSDKIGNLGDLEKNIPTGAFAKYTISNNSIASDIIFNITSLYYDESAEVYTDVTYNPSTKKFNGVDINTSPLPVYYKYNDKFITPTLDENHKYSIEVYDYAINITAFSAINSDAVINNIEITDNINSDFLQDINISCKTVNQDSVLKAQLYNSESQLISEQKTAYNGSYKLSFKNLPNTDAEYTVKLCLEDKNGAVISPIYTKIYSIASVPVLYGNIMSYCCDEDIYGNEFLLILFCDNNGEEKSYTSTNILINNENYVFGEDIPIGVFAKFAFSDNKNAVLNYDTDFQTYNNVTYNPSTQKFVGLNVNTKALPVYYKYNDKFVTPILDENHKYNIEVYDYAVNITSISALNKAETIINIDTENCVDSDFSQYVKISCDAANNDAVLAGEIYDTNSKLTAEKKTEYNNGYILSFSGLSGRYTAKLWLEDKTGNIISPTYTKTIETGSLLVSSGYIMDYAFDMDYFERMFVSIKLCDTSGNIFIYNSENITLNGVQYSNKNGNLKDLEWQRFLSIGIFVEYAVLDGEIAVLNFTAEPMYISDFEYAASADKIIVNLTVSNNFDTKKNVNIIIASYKSGKLDQASCVQTAIKANGSEYLLEKLPNVNKADKLKIFIWESLDNISPYNPPLSLDINYD